MPPNDHPASPDPTIALLHHGGVRSLVASAMLAAKHNPDHLVLIHVSDARARTSSRLEHVRHQAAHFNMTRIRHVRVTQPNDRLVAPPQANQPTVQRPPLERVTVLTLALAHAIDAEASKLVWPAQVNAHFDDVAAITEQCELAAHLAALGHTADKPPTIDTPLVEMSDKELVELGEHLNVPWRLAFSCVHAGDIHCNACPGCIRRAEAFDAAGVIDPTKPGAKNTPEKRAPTKRGL